jgi:M6 family metalloprotease-like protein
VKKIIQIILLLIFSIQSFAIFEKNYPIDLQQPDGTTIHCFITGDEFYQRVHDENDFTIIRDVKTGFLVYAVLENDELISTNFIVGKSNPQDLGLSQGINISVEKRNKLRKEFLQQAPKIPKIERNPNKEGETTINTLVVYINFADYPEFPDIHNTYENWFNAENQVSMRQYFKDASYGEVNVISNFYPIQNQDSIISYQDIYPRSYYCPYNAVTNPNGYQGSYTSREHGLLKRAIEAVASQIPTSINFDSNNDGNVDNAIFIVRGLAGDWNSLLWPHQWSLFSENVYVNGKKINTYNLQIESNLKSERASVLVHEMYHSFGIPDLYRYDNNGTPIGIWDVMASNQQPPQATAAYLKNKYTMFARPINEITTSGTYQINQTWEENNNCYKIRSPYHTGVSDEFFIVEFRSKSVSWEAGIPEGGLLVYRINPTQNGNGNGPPDEIIVIRGNINTATLNSSRNYLTEASSPQLILSSGQAPGFGIFNVRTSDETMTFDVIFDAGISLSPNDLNFPNNSITIPSTAQTIKIFTYHTTEPLIAEIIGTDAQYFEITNQNLVEVNGTVKVRFLPTEVRNYNAMLKIQSGTFSKTVNLTGNGIIVPLISDFEPSSVQTGKGRQIYFYDKSTQVPNSWNWTFEGGIPATSNEQNPIVTYNNEGTFSVTLQSSNNYSQDEITKTNLIFITDEGADYNCNSSFEYWTDDVPNCWFGQKTTIKKDHIAKIDTTAYLDNFACQLINGMNSFNKFSTKPISVVADKEYAIEFYVKGKGKISTSLFDGRPENNGFSENNETINIDTTEYIKISQHVIAKTDNCLAEFIINVAQTLYTKGHIIIDNLIIKDKTKFFVENYENFNVKIFPNPTNGIINIKSEDEVFIKVYNIFGELILQDSGITKKQLNLENQAKGIYLITINNKKMEYKTYKIIIN